MKYDPKTKEELPEVKGGKYSFEVIGAIEKESKSSNDMIEIQLSVAVDGRNLKLRDYLVSIPTCLPKLEKFCQCVGLDFNAGELDAAGCVYKKGEALFELDIPNEKGNRYLKVAKYLPSDAKPAASDDYQYDDSNVPSQSNIDDDIPF